jgi:crotonobetainyl-CoA:carnitine CoA-transferase CaiB-like acyl-CoA transferase
MILADLGADVIKIENPQGGDDTRQWGPPYLGTESAYYLSANRTKRSVVADLRTAEGVALVKSLARQSDVLVENYKAGGLERFGLGYKEIAAENPGIIYCSISGYGRQSPLADRPGYDYVMQAEGGLMAVTGRPDQEPVKVGVAVADLFTGMASVQAILAAVIARGRDGLGQHIDMALYDCQLSMLANVGSSWLSSGREPSRYGNGHPTVVPYQTFATATSMIVVAVGNDRQFSMLCSLLGQPDLSSDISYATNSARVANRDALIATLSPLFLRRDADHWLNELRRIAVPCGAVRSVGEALEAPETAARDMICRVSHPTVGEIRVVGSPLKFSRTPVVAPVAPPLLGQHTDEVTRALAENDVNIPIG